MRKHVAGEVGGDHDFGAQRPRGRYRHRIDQRAVDQPAVADQNRRKDARQRIRCSHRIHHPAVGDPGFVAGAHLGRHRGKFQRQVLDQGLADRGLQLRRKLVAADQARTVELEIEIGKDTARLQAARPFFQRIEVPGRKRPADHGANRGADDDIGDDAVGDQRLDDADMGKAARRSATERKSDDRPPADGLVADFSVVLASSDPVVQHAKSNLLKGRSKAIARTPLPPEWLTSMVYAGGRGEIVTGARRISMSNGSGRRRFHPSCLTNAGLNLPRFQ